MSNDEFVVEIRHDDSEKVSVRVKYPEQVQAEKVSTVLEEKSAWSARFRRLATRWTETAIGFFEVVPFLSDVGFMYADHDLEENTLALVRKLATSRDNFEEDGVKIETYNLPTRESKVIAKTLAKTAQLSTTANVMKRSAFTALLAEYEALIGEMLTLAVEIRPSVLVDDEPRVSLQDISDYDSLKDLQDAKIKQRLENLLHGKSHVETLDWIGKNFGVNLTSNTSLVSSFVEVCQRRHLVSHAGSRANGRYRRICEEAGCRSEEMLSLDEKVSISRKYLRRATARVYQVGYFTLHLLWQKLLEDYEESDGVVLSCSHDFLDNDLTKMARRLTEFSLGRKKNRPHDRVHAYLIINQAQAYKFDEVMSAEEREKKILECLSQRDWSDRSPMIDLVLDCLSDEFDGISQKVVAAASVGDSRLTYPDIYLWNIFRVARENSEFLRGVEQAFGTVRAIEGQSAPEG